MLRALLLLAVGAASGFHVLPTLRATSSRASSITAIASAGESVKVKALRAELDEAKTELRRAGDGGNAIELINAKEHIDALRDRIELQVGLDYQAAKADDQTEDEGAGADAEEDADEAIVSKVKDAIAKGLKTRGRPLSMSAEPVEGDGIAPALNVLGTTLQCCCADVGGSGIGTGFYRDGHCSTGPMDEGRHTVCIEATAEFLAFSTSVGNDLSTPIPEYNFPGVKPGDRWCLCATRWVQALNAGAAPKLCLLATHEKTLSIVRPEDVETLQAALKKYAVDAEEAERVLNELDAARAKLESMLK